MASLFFEDLEEGQRFISTGRTVTEADVVGFAGLSGDFNPIHLDAEEAKEGIFGRRVAHGILGMAMATGFLHSLALFTESMDAMLSVEGWDFKGPIFINDTLHLDLIIESKRLTSRGLAGIVRRRLRLINQHDNIVQEGVITVMIRCREPGPARGRAT